ncbi:MAG: phosphotyrosine protein phosphatase [Rhodospirillaceae bacterium]|jgi:protein-tyrosine phosphatase|nr:phosphotyrosine protein phosphatase [Rhodospirillaceae bacterium]
MVKVIFVCSGNICRSPTAEGVFRAMVDAAGLSEKIEIDSAGTGSWHEGERSDERSTETALRRGIDLSMIRARQIDQYDYFEFDYILAMDGTNFNNLMRTCPPDHRNKIIMFLEFAPHLKERDVPDPYYGGPQGFDHVLNLIEAASQGLLTEIREKHF